MRDLVVEYPRRGGGVTRSVDGVSFTVNAGECFGIVGESGSGKTTTARAVLRLAPTREGTIVVGGQDVLSLSRRELRKFRRFAQMVYQDPQASLDPRMTIQQLVEEALVIHEPAMRAVERRARAIDLLEQVGLNPDYLGVRPASLSGGQMQRVAIARALAARPQLLVCDEVVSALDVSVQAQILNLLKKLQRDLGLTVIFISHDLGVISYVCHRVAVVFEGRIVETGTAREVIGDAREEYTRELVLACPDPDPVTARRIRSERLAASASGLPVPANTVAPKKVEKE
ncbi:ATP-binding cassette domain-containing protein [Herbiconiux sp.]|uniref:ATP-binding cassette domain-containing protein n=1 Tax=Herbiconiux sp. TaxID=1871186 RepID=UPI0025BA505D|nr:ATP-binding cassette domain-containing protein [Herbiconiux sp.]